MNYIEENYDVAIVGAGHAGCEAALACARLGLETIVFTVSVDSIALMPCNPNIGGTSKGHLVRELDALGGEMGRNIDKTFIQSRMLNESKGPAVHSLRAQADKQAYTREMRKTMESTEHLTIRQAEVSELITELLPDGTRVCCGVKTVSGASYHTRAVVLATGVYLNARCIFGEVSEYTGPNGLKAANHLTDSLCRNGIIMNRFKTGTPARIDGRTIDYSKMEEQKGDVPVVPFSFETDPASVQKPQVSCWLTHTGAVAHELIRANIDRSPLYNGSIKSTGPRYCPSIEYAVIHATPGLEHAKVVRNAYAIEYDCIDARQLDATLEFKKISGLFAGGQFNGSSGYEEAAVQGFMAGVNAAMHVLGRESFVIDRSEGYIGVLIDDLVTKESHEPYRMMTSRSEYRLLLRQDNADLRLSEKGHEMGLISDERIGRVRKKKAAIDAEIARLKKTTVGANERVNSWLEAHGSTALKTGATLAEVICRPELNYELVHELDPDRPELRDDVREQVNIEVKYEGYIRRQEQQVKQFRKLENRMIPEDIDYHEVGSLRLEAIQKLDRIRPRSVGQASRISGVSPADISVLLVWMEAHRK